jgi:hypothetical protein
MPGRLLSVSPRTYRDIHLRIHKLPLLAVAGRGAVEHCDVVNFDRSRASSTLQQGAGRAA